ncbi:CCB3/YggT protein [Klenkia terrae]|uniref:YggT family protein n=1 Tax=Klenkia terrae TaxID=1052259 RepID=UPI001754C503|nr:YggT family protein [Klenkia terrae]SSC25650.1 CCB3/YggT protein [Klenkia terrae]
MLALLAFVLLLFQLVLIARVVVDWGGVPAPASGARLGGARRLVHRVTEPVIAPVRRVLPPLRIGGVGIDLAFTVVFLGVVVLRSVLLSV